MATATARRTALRHSRALERLERIGIKALPGAARTIRVAVLTAYERSEDMGAAIYAALEQFEATLRDAMVAGHLQGHLRSIQTAAAAMAERSKAAGAYDQAVEFMRRRLALRPEQIELLEGLYGPEAVRVTREVGGVLEAKAQKAAAEITARGMHVRQGIAEMRKAFDAAGVAPTQSHLLETLVRTQTHMAYGAGRWNANQDPAIQEILWGYEYVTVGDDRVRPNHQALDGMKLPKDDSRWGELWPPNGFNCRCELIEIFDEDQTVVAPQPMIVDEVVVLPQADVDWAFNPGLVFADGLPASDKLVGLPAKIQALPRIPPKLRSARLFKKTERNLPTQATNDQTTRSAVYGAAKEIQRPFETIHRNVAKELRGRLFVSDLPASLKYCRQSSRPAVVVAPPKGYKRATEKVASDYGGRWNRLRDVVRSTIVVNSADDVPQAVGLLRKEFEAKGWRLAVSPKNRFERPLQGYRDIVLNIRAPNGLITEVQLMTKPMFLAKAKGHRLYQEVRSIQARATREGRTLLPTERQRIDMLSRRMERLYDAAWDESLKVQS